MQKTIAQFGTCLLYTDYEQLLYMRHSVQYPYLYKLYKWFLNSLTMGRREGKWSLQLREEDANIRFCLRAKFNINFVFSQTQNLNN